MEITLKVTRRFNNWLCPVSGILDTGHDKCNKYNAKNNYAMMLMITVLAILKKGLMMIVMITGLKVNVLVTVIVMIMTTFQ